MEGVSDAKNGYGETFDFAQVILENLRISGVQQAHKDGRITFTSLTAWPGHLVCGEGRYMEGGEEDGVQRRAAIFIGPSSAPSPAPTLWTRRAKPPKPGSTCS